jgi:hypothetical protein
MEATCSSETLSGFERITGAASQKIELFLKKCKVGFEVLTVVVMKNYIFWNTTQICLLPSS